VCESIATIRDVAIFSSLAADGCAAFWQHKLLFLPNSLISRYLTTIQTENLVAHVSRQDLYEDSPAFHLIVVDFGATTITFCDCHVHELVELLWLVERFLEEPREAKQA
jgi:hypothetical protein